MAKMPADWAKIRMRLTPEIGVAHVGKQIERILAYLSKPLTQNRSIRLAKLLLLLARHIRLRIQMDQTHGAPPLSGVMQHAPAVTGRHKK